MLRYAINGKFDDDYRESNEIWEEVRKEHHEGWEMFQCSFKVGNIDVKLFKNGHINLKGITDEQMKRIIVGFEVLEKYRERVR